MKNSFSNNSHSINLNIHDLDYKSPIPKIIHRIWMVFNPDKADTPEKYKENDKILKALHPDWYFMEWDDKKTLNFVHDYYPEFYNTYISYDKPIMRHDSVRYLILKQFGGVFIQHSFVFKKNIEPLLADFDLVFSTKSNHPIKKGELANNIMASIQGHKFWDEMIKAMIEIKNNPPNKKLHNVMSYTGPFILNNTLSLFLNENINQNIKILDCKYLMPFYTFEKNEKNIKNKCIDSLNSDECFSLFKDAFAYTPWNGDWNSKEYNQAQINLSYIDSNTILPKFDKIFIPNLHRAPERWTRAAVDFYNLGLKFERFQSVDGYKITITDIENNQTFKGVDIKRKIIQLKKNIEYKIKCDNEIQQPLEIYVNSTIGIPMAANLGVTCTKALIREEIIRRNYNNTIIFEDDFKPNPENLIVNINNYIEKLPKYDIAYLHNFVVKDNLLKIENDLVFSRGKAERWWGDWAFILSKSGAEKLNLGYKFDNPSDRYSNELAVGKSKKPGVDNFTAYFARHNFSMFSDKHYDGKSLSSFATKMGCRQWHNSDPKDCSKIIELDAVIAINNDEEFSFSELSENNKELDFVIFAASDEKSIQIHDILNDEVFNAAELISEAEERKELLYNSQYKITCNPKVIHPIEFIYNTGEGEKLPSIKDLGNWCTNLMLWRYIKNQDYINVVILKNNSEITQEYIETIKKLIADAPKNYDLAIVDNNPNEKELSIDGNGNIQNEVTLCLGNRNNWLLSAQAIDKLLSMKEHNGSLENNFLCLKDDKLYSHEINNWSILTGQLENILN